MIQYAAITNKGDRPINEDSIGTFAKDKNKCFILCDGLGGHGMGDVASSLVIDVFNDRFEKTNDLPTFLDSAFYAAQEMLMAEQHSKMASQKMKTTAVVLAMDDKKAYIAHVGDSRLYAFRKNKIEFRTKDHSIPQMLCMTHEIKESEIRFHPDRNLLLRVMGVEWEKPMYERMKPLALKKYQAFLLCSDGFWELIDETEMCSLLEKSNSVQEWIREMTEVVCKNGKDKNMDNYSAIAVWNV